MTASGPGASSNRPGPVAAVDCGTNSTRLLVADADGATVARLMQVTRLGQGVDATHRLDPAAMVRTLMVLAEYRRVMDDAGVGRRRLVATSAVRDAVNGVDFLVAAGEAVGGVAELLSGMEEGRTAYAGATAGLTPAAGATAGLTPAAGDDVVVDIGGGSTELIVGRGEVTGVVSLDIGCVRLSERHFHHDPPAGEVAMAVADIDAELGHAVEAVPVLAHLPDGSRLIGLAGTVSTLAMLECGLAEYHREQVHHARLSAARVAHWCEVLAAETSADRSRRPGMVPGREDVIVAGALVLRQVMGRFGFDECVVSESDILDGLVAGLLSSPR